MSTRVGKIIKDYRKKNNYTQFKMAEKIGVSEFYISALETGARNPGRKTLIKLAQEMNVPIDSLLDLKTEYGIKHASDDIYSKLKSLPEDKRIIAENLIDSIIEVLRSN